MGHNALLVHDSLGDAGLPDATGADERDVFAFKDVRDGLLNNCVSAEENIRLRRNSISRIGRDSYGRTAMQELVRRTMPPVW